jgi:hypothetical protein
VRAISLWQPWASAIALGKKQIETRSWTSHYRGPIAIHASVRWTQAQRDFCKTHLTWSLHTIPFGAFIAVADLVDIVPTQGLEVSDLERLWGDYSPGRYAWLLRDVRPLPEPIRRKGAQRFFNFPDRLLA